MLALEAFGCLGGPFGSRMSVSRGPVQVARRGPVVLPWGCLDMETGGHGRGRPAVLDLVPSPLFDYISGAPWDLGPPL